MSSRERLKKKRVLISVYKDSAGWIYGFEAEGHAGDVPSGGNIICAGISAIAYAIAGSLQKLTGGACHTEDVEKGFMSCFTPSDIDEYTDDKAQTIMEVMEIGFLQMAKAYPQEIKLIYEEV